jgi:hypothetical protein
MSRIATMPKRIVPTEQAEMPPNAAEPQGGDVPATKRPRLNFELSDPAYARICDMKELMGADSIKDVTRTAFRVLEWYLVKTKQQGYSLQLVKSGEKVTVDLGI